MKRKFTYFVPMIEEFSTFLGIPTVLYPFFFDIHLSLKLCRKYALSKLMRNVLPLTCCQFVKSHDS